MNFPLPLPQFPLGYALGAGFLLGLISALLTFFMVAKRHLEDREEYLLLAITVALATIFHALSFWMEWHHPSATGLIVRTIFVLTGTPTITTIHRDNWRESGLILLGLTLFAGVLFLLGRAIGMS